MSKLIEAAKEARQIAECDHELIPQPRLTPTSKMDRFHCPKCGATLFSPRPSQNVFDGVRPLSDQRVEALRNNYKRTHGDPE